MFGTKSFFINRKKISVLKFLAGALALFILLAVLNFFNPGLRNIFFAVSSPFQRFFWSAGESSSGFLGAFLSAGANARENQNLKNENQNLLAQISSMQSVISGNQALSAVSLSCQNDNFQLEMAGIMGIANSDKLTINKGSSDGIAENMPVINQQKALAGIISKTYKDFSEVTLITNKNSVIGVKVFQPADSGKSIEGVVKGRGELSAFLDLVPIDAPLNQNDILATSALEGLYPKDLLVGRVEKVEKNDQNPHQQAQIELFFNLSSADNLFVITNYKR